jgi:hypothetical protein
MLFPDNVTFGCRALDGPSLGEAGEIKLSSSVSLYGRPPLELDATWQRWLGSIQTNQFNQSKFFIVAMLRNPAVPINSLERIQEIIHSYHSGLLLHGYAYCSGGLEVLGNVGNPGSLHIGPVGPVFPHVPIANRALHSPSIDLLKEAHKTAESLLALYKYPLRFMRLRRSFDAWMRGIQETVPGYRLHNFVRAAEGLANPRRGKATADFVDHCQLFSGRGRRNAALLEQLYDLRSCMEHVKQWRSELRRVRGLNVRDSLLFRTLQAELLASAAFVRILGSRRLLRHFAAQATIGRFWTMPESDRAKLWGKPISLSREAERLYIRLDP